MLLRSAAKVNLTLDILKRREDGYHELASIVHTVGFWDELEIEFRDGETIDFECSRSDLQNEDNLCVRAVRKWQQATGQRFGTHIRLQKNIPTGAGLGGGSANAAAILVALQKSFGSPLKEPELIELAKGLGADVPLFLRGGALLMEGIGEKLAPLEPLEGWLVILKPELSLPTGPVFNAWSENKFVSGFDTQKMREVWNNGEVESIAPLLGNDLERATATLTDVPRHCVNALLEIGSLGAQMSGSGSACFGLFAEKTQADEATQRLSELLAKDVLLTDSQIIVAPFCSNGVEVVS